jgi:Flp pilus assembly pilin Flp
MRYLWVWKTRLGSAARSERGQALVEYTLALALVSVVALAALTQFSTTVQNLYGHKLNNTLETVLKTHGHCGHKACKRP